MLQTVTNDNEMQSTGGEKTFTTTRTVGLRKHHNCKEIGNEASNDGSECNLSERNQLVSAPTKIRNRNEARNDRNERKLSERAQPESAPATVRIKVRRKNKPLAKAVRSSSKHDSMNTDTDSHSEAETQDQDQDTTETVTKNENKESTEEEGLLSLAEKAFLALGEFVGEGAVSASRKIAQLAK